jgi:membrane protease YdiL (CAAX protease family)
MMHKQNWTKLSILIRSSWICVKSNWPLFTFWRSLSLLFFWTQLSCHIGKRVKLQLAKWFQLQCYIWFKSLKYRLNIFVDTNELMLLSIIISLKLQPQKFFLPEYPYYKTEACQDSMLGFWLCSLYINKMRVINWYIKNHQIKKK